MNNKQEILMRIPYTTAVAITIHFTPKRHLSLLKQATNEGLSLSLKKPMTYIFLIAFSDIPQLCYIYVLYQIRPIVKPKISRSEQEVRNVVYQILSIVKSKIFSRSEQKVKTK